MIRIPSDDKPALTKLALLPDAAVSELRKKLESAASKKEIRDLSAEDVGPISDLSKEDVEKIVGAVVTLNRTRAYYDPPPDQFADDIREAMLSVSGFPREADKTERFKKRIVEFLSMGPVTQSAKAVVLRYDHERTVHAVRILTDMRPIFGRDVEKSPDAVVLTHTLKISYHRAAQRVDDAFFALDEADLQDLKKAVVRAEQKAKSIRAALANSALKVLK